MSIGNKTPGKLPHTLADHAFGAASGHAHLPGDEHDHDHDGSGDFIEQDSQELARVELLSIGIDIGSSGTQIVFSQLHMYGPGEPAAMRRKVKSRETLYMSPVVLTPFSGGDTIDVERLRGSIARAFQQAGLAPEDIETGAVILTGAAAQRSNASAIAETLAFEAGDIVTAAAGDHMEAALAAYGSGAVERSRLNKRRILNVDIGGATTKFALIDGGHVIATAAMNVGGRQMAVDAKRKIIRLDAAASLHARRCGINWSLGEMAKPGDMLCIASRMANDVMAILRGELSLELPGLFLTKALGQIDFESVMFSGGVAEYIYGRERRDFGDLGKLLGDEIARQIESGRLAVALEPAGECIRATVLGCSEYAVQMSGATSFISAHSILLPRRNLPVLQPPYDFRGVVDAAGLSAAIRSHREAFGDGDAIREAAYAFRWRGDAEHSRILAFARGIAAGLADRVAAGVNIYLLVEGDVALTLGSVLKEEIGLKNEILVVDGIVLRDFDFVDIGRLRLPSGMVPVTVKSLQFGGER